MRSGILNSVNTAAPKPMSQAEYAAYRGVGRSAVSNYKRDGLLVFVEGEGGKLLVDVTRTDAKLNAKLDPTRGRPTRAQIEGVEGAQAQPQALALPLAPAAQPVGDKLGEVRTDLLREQRIAARLKNAREAGQLVAFAEYERRSHEWGRLARERVLAAIQVQSEHLAAEREPRAIIALLTAEVDRVFAGLADQLDAEDAGDDDADAPPESEEPEEGP